MRSFLVLFLLATPAIAGEPPLSNDEVKKTVESHLGDVKNCMITHGKATGKLVVAFAVKPDGSVENPRPQEASSNAALDKCIAGAFGKWTFPKPRGGALAGQLYPFVFSVVAPPKQAVGTIKPEALVEVFKAKDHLEDMSVCLKANKGKDFKQGLIKFEIVVGTDGKVKEAKVAESNTKLPKLDDCMVNKVRNWGFPKPDRGGEAAFHYPFMFNNSDD
jgi:hypothetical protein